MRRHVDDLDESCPPVAHRLSRLGRYEFRDAATRNAEKVVEGPAVATPNNADGQDDVPWRQSSGVATLYQETNASS